MNPTSSARRLRRDQTPEEKALWLALRAGRFAGFKFRRQHPCGVYYLDFYCPAAKLSIELDGFQHGLPENIPHDLERKKFLTTQGTRNCGFGIANGAKIVPGCSWKFGMPCSNELAAWWYSEKLKTAGSFRPNPIN